MIVHVVMIQQLCLYKISLRLALSLDSFKVKNKTKHSCRFNGLIVLQLPDIKSNMWSLLYSVSLKKKKKKKVTNILNLKAVVCTEHRLEIWAEKKTSCPCCCFLFMVKTFRTLENWDLSLKVNIRSFTDLYCVKTIS